MSSEKPSYYAVIPAFVRLDKEISANAKILFGEMVALTRLEGYCWATNAYFAELYEVSERSISAWVAELETQGHIRTEFVEGGRRIFLRGVEEIFYGGWKKSSTLKEEKSSKEGSIEPQKEGEGASNNTITNTVNRAETSSAQSSSEDSGPSPVPSFEDFLEERGITADYEGGDSESVAAKVYRDENGKKVSESSLKREYTQKYRPKGYVRRTAEFDPDTEKFIEVAQKLLKARYGANGVITRQTKEILSKNLVLVYPKEFVREYAQWFFDNETIDKKYKFNLSAIASSKFINQFIAETGTSPE